MKTYKHLYEKLCTWDNIENAYWKARKRKSNNLHVKEFEKHWRLHLCNLLRELCTQTYKPKPLRKFILRDPKTRTICVSDFRDRVVHHALINILQPIFEPRFIHDSYASRKGKGTLPALKRFKEFQRKLTQNGRLVQNTRNANNVQGFVLKADIRHYFENVDHHILLEIIGSRVKDKRVLWLVKTILDNNPAGIPGKGMPLGNWTSQFFANVYLNELDQFVKHHLKAKNYIRYVDDFVILHCSKSRLWEWQQRIADFLKGLKLELHPDKCKISPLSRGSSFLGFRCFYHYKLVRQRNVRKILGKLEQKINEYAIGNMDASDVLETWQGWNAYAMHGNTYRLRQHLQQQIENELMKKSKPSA